MAPAHTEQPFPTDRLCKIKTGFASLGHTSASQILLLCRVGQVLDHETLAAANRGVAQLRSDRPKHRKHHDGHLKNPALESTLPSQGCRYAVNSPCGRVIATSMRQTQLDFNSSGTICSMRLGASNSRQAALRASSRDGPDDACPVSDARSEVSCVRFRETHAYRTGCPSRSRPGCVLEARRRGAGRRRDGLAPGMGPRRSGRAGDLHRPGPAKETPRGQAEAHRGHLRSGVGARGGRGTSTV